MTKSFIRITVSLYLFSCYSNTEGKLIKSSYGYTLCMRLYILYSSFILHSLSKQWYLTEYCNTLPPIFFDIKAKSYFYRQLIYISLSKDRSQGIRFGFKKSQAIILYNDRYNKEKAFWRTVKQQGAVWSK